MDRIYIKESLIFSKQWKQEDIIKNMSFNYDDDYEMDDKK